MFDTMTVVKAAGGFLSVFLIFLLGNWAGSLIYSGGGHGDGQASYVIDTGEEDAADEIAEEVDLATLLAAADAQKGARVFGKCKACHKLDGTNGTGPYLNGVIGRDIGSVAGFGYSKVFGTLEGAWTPEAMNSFLTDVKGFAPGTKMSFAGLKKDTDRANLITYLAAQ